MSYLAKLRGLSAARLSNELEDKISKHSFDLLDSESASSEIAMTNVTGGWGIEDLEIIDEAADIDLSGDEVSVSITCRAIGEQDDDKPWCGDKLSIEAVAIIGDDGNVRFDEVSAERNWPDVEDESGSFVKAK